MERRRACNYLSGSIFGDVGELNILRDNWGMQIFLNVFLGRANFRKCGKRKFFRVFGNEYCLKNKTNFQSKRGSGEINSVLVATWSV